MVLTRKMSDISRILEEKLDAFKVSMLDDVRSEIDAHFENKKRQFDEHVKKVKDDLDSHKIDLEMRESLIAIQNHVKELQTETKRLREQNTTQGLELDDLQQYVRRQNLRIFGMEVDSNTTASVVEGKVRDFLNELDIPTDSLDRAHVVGKKKRKEDGSFTQPVIVRFTSFKNRTLFYKKRKEFKKKHKLGVSLDLTKNRLSLLNDARERINDVENVEFVYSDINCNLRIFTTSGNHIKFDSLCNLENVLANL